MLNKKEYKLITSLYGVPCHTEAFRTFKSTSMAKIVEVGRV